MTFREHAAKSLLCSVLLLLPCFSLVVCNKKLGGGEEKPVDKDEGGEKAKRHLV